MNLVNQILEQLSGGASQQLGSLIGADAETTERAASAAVPSLLSVLAGMTATDDGTRKLTNALGSIDTSGIGNFAQMLGGNANSLLGKGSSVLGSLLGDSVISGLSSSLSRFTGLNSGIVKSLLGYLTPLVLGKVATQWKNQGGTTQALSSLFAQQRENIASAVPSGFSLADIPSVDDVRKTTYSAARRVAPETVAAASPTRWMAPVAIALALLGGYLLWQLLARPGAQQAAVDRTVTTADETRVMRPELPAEIDVPALPSVRDELGGFFKSMDTTFTDIRDAASAERAMPALRDLNTKIDSMNQMLARLPEASRVTLRPVLEEQVKAVTEKATAVSAIEGIGTQIKSLIQEILAKLAKWISPDAP